MTLPHPDPWSRPRAARPVFSARRCRRRTAQALAAGRAPEEVAALQRVTLRAVEDLLDEDGFQALLAHYRAVAALAPEDRLERLTQTALELLELGVETGDLQVAMFVVAERRAGRHPGRTLAAHALERIEAEAARQRPVAPRALAGPPVRPRLPAGPWNHLAAAFGAVEVERRALTDLAALPALRRRTLARLADRLLGEAERIGTAPVSPSRAARAQAAQGARGDGGSPVLPQDDERLARRVAQLLRGRYHQGEAAALRLEARRQAADFGRIASPAPAEDTLFAPEPGPATPLARPEPQAERSPPADDPPERSVPRADHRHDRSGDPSADDRPPTRSAPHSGPPIAAAGPPDGGDPGPPARAAGPPPDRFGWDPLGWDPLGWAPLGPDPLGADPLAAYDRYLGPRRRTRRPR